MNFLQMLLKEEIAADSVDDFVDKWHEGDGKGLTLAEYLGFTPHEYAWWAENPHSLETIVKERRIWDTT